MTPAARVQAAITVLDEILAGRPAEQALISWARKSRFAGSKDRAAIRDHVFDALRCRRTYAALGGAQTGRGLMLGAARESGAYLDDLFDGSNYGPPSVAASESGRTPDPGAEAGDIPDWLWPEFERSLGDAADEGAAYLRNRAPVFLRVNTRRTTPDALIEALRGENITAHTHPLSPAALEVTDGARRLRNTPAFQDGSFELQDAASQAVVDALPLRDGMRVLDYCAGGGGKTLAMGAKAKVDLVAHDANVRRMSDLPDRAARASLSVKVASDLTGEGLFDLVLCDAPCSGSGSWRRAPDGKWSLSPERLQQLVATQDEILSTVPRYVTQAGTLAYVTCSVLKIENEDRVNAFLNRHPEWRCTALHRWPLNGGGDGFFLSLFERS